MVPTPAACNPSTTFVPMRPVPTTTTVDWYKRRCPPFENTGNWLAWKPATRSKPACHRDPLLCIVVSLNVNELCCWTSLASLGYGLLDIWTALTYRQQALAQNER